MTESKSRLAGAGKVLLRAAALAAMVASLQGCIGLAVGGAVMGTLAATDRRTFGAQADDKEIAVRAEARIKNIFGENAHVNVNSFNRKVLLTGEARDAATKAQIEREVAAIQGVASVANELEIAELSTYTQRSNDTLITTKIKASFVDQKDLSVNVLKVVTERGVVYLMGRVTTSEGTLAGEVASGVSGVRKVVKLFEYINQDEFSRRS